MQVPPTDNIVNHDTKAAVATEGAGRFDFRSLIMPLFVCCILLGTYALNTSFESPSSALVYDHDGNSAPLTAEWSLPVAIRTSSPGPSFLLLCLGLTVTARKWRAENTRIGSALVVLTTIALVGGDMCVQTFRESQVTASTLGVTPENRVSGWQFYSTNTDVLTHLHKWTPGSVYTPTYQLFLRVVASPRHSRSELLSQAEPLCLKTHLAWHAIADPDSGLLLVAQAQRVLTLAAFLFLFFSIARVSTSSFAAILLTYAWCSGLLFASPIASLYSLQCVDGKAFSCAIAWTAVSMMLLAVHGRSTGMLHTAAALAGLAVITRPQNIILLPMLMLAVIALFRMKPPLRSRLAVVAALAVFAAIFLVPPGLCYFSSHRSLTPTNSFADILFATSLYGGEAEDVTLFHDDKTAQYFSRSLQLQSEYRDENPNLPRSGFGPSYVLRNQSIGYQVANEMQMGIVQSRQTRQQIALQLICSHPYRLASTAFIPLLGDAMACHRNLIFGVPTYWLLVPYLVICLWLAVKFFARRSEPLLDQYDSAGDLPWMLHLLVIAHLGNLVVVPIFGGHGGYLHYTEGFLVFGVMLFFFLILKGWLTFVNEGKQLTHGTPQPQN